MKLFVDVNVAEIEQGAAVSLHAADTRDAILCGNDVTDGHQIAEVFVDVNRFLVLDKTDKTLKHDQLLRSDGLALLAWNEIQSEKFRIDGEIKRLNELNLIKDSVVLAAHETEKNLTAVELNDILKNHLSDNAVCVSEDILNSFEMDISKVFRVFSYVQYMNYKQKMYVVFDPNDMNCDSDGFKSDEFEDINSTARSITTDLGRLEYICSCYTQKLEVNDNLFISDIIKILDRHLGLMVKKVEL